MTQRPGEPDPEKTVTNPTAPFDPDATVRQPAPEPEPDAEATVSGPIVRPPTEPDAEATVSGPIERPAAEPDAEATVRVPVFREMAAAAQADQMVAVPAPGKRRNPFAPKHGRLAAQASLDALGGLNPLLAAANPILGGVAQIRQTVRLAEPHRLLDTLRRQIEGFVASADNAGVPAATVAVANYALCALLDESAAATPWGRDWLKNGLLQAVHREDWGGEKFFMLLAKMAEDPEANRDLLEFFHVCLALGYEGRYRLIDDGARQLAEVREKIYDLVRRYRPRTDRVLSERWRAAPARIEPQPQPGAGLRWAIAGAAVVVLAGHQLLGVPGRMPEVTSPVPPVAIAPPPPGAAPPPTPAAAPAPPVAAPSSPADAPATKAPAPPVAVSAPPALAALLADDIQRGTISLAEAAGRNRIEIRHDRQFLPGTARLAPEVEPVLARVAAALDKVPGRILVSGHTDGVPIATTRFPSNQELSLARAQSAARLVARKLADPKRLEAEGKAASEPVAPDDSEGNRAKNRRVVISVEVAR